MASSSVFLRNEKMLAGLPFQSTGRAAVGRRTASNGCCQYDGLLPRLSRRASCQPPTPSLAMSDLPDWNRALASPDWSATASGCTAPLANSAAFHSSAARYSSVSTRCTSLSPSSFHFGGTAWMIAAVFHRSSAPHTLPPVSSRARSRRSWPFLTSGVMPRPSRTSLAVEDRVGDDLARERQAVELAVEDAELPRVRGDVGQVRVRRDLVAREERREVLEDVLDDLGAEPRRQVPRSGCRPSPARPWPRRAPWPACRRRRCRR